MCWGDNSRNQLEVANTLPYVSISLGEFHGCGLTDQSTVECWGNDDFGQASPPTGTFISVDTGTRHSCGLRDDDSLECWGFDFSGQSSPP